MLLHNFIYAIKGIIKEKTSIFWAAVFPFLLGTMFYVSFGSISERIEQYHEIPVGYVQSGEEENSAMFIKVLESLEDEKGIKMFKLEKMSEQEAEKKLNKEEIDGYYKADEKLSLVISQNGTNQTILNLFLQQYQQKSSIIQDVMENNPSKLQAVLAAMQEELSIYTKVNETEGNMDGLSQYFYALIAMSCLFGSYLSLERAKKLQANISPLGARCQVAPVRKSVVIMAEFISCLLIQFLVECALLVYLIGVCGINMGDKTGYMLLTCFIGSAFGIALGFCIGSVAGWSESIRSGINSCITMGMSFFSGLMINKMKHIIENTVPIVNRINPATLITDALYALNVYETMERYWRNMITLTLITVLLCVVSMLSVRRTRYASI